MVCQEQKSSNCCRTASTPRRTNLSRHHVWYACATLRPDRSCVCFLVGTNSMPAVLTSGSRITAHARSAAATHLKVDTALNEHAFMLPTRMMTRSGTAFFSLTLFFLGWGLRCVANTFACSGVCQESSAKLTKCLVAELENPVCSFGISLDPLIINMCACP